MKTPIFLDTGYLLAVLNTRDKYHDLAVAVALASSLLGKPVAQEAVVFGEVGLSGEIRAVSAARQRIREAAKFGLSRCIMPSSCKRDAVAADITPEPAAKIVDAIRIALE